MLGEFWSKIYFLVIGVIVSLFGVWALISSFILSIRGIVTTGTVVGFEEKKDSSKNGGRYVNYYPIIEYRDQGYSLTKFVYQSGNRKPKWKIGKSLRIVFDPNNPTRVNVHDFFSLWLGPILLLFMGAGACFVFFK